MCKSSSETYQDHCETQSDSKESEPEHPTRHSSSTRRREISEQFYFLI